MDNYMKHACVCDSTIDETTQMNNNTITWHAFWCWHERNMIKQAAAK